MKIAVTSQNFRSITGHAGKTRRFLIYDVNSIDREINVERVDLPKDMSIHENGNSSHPIDAVDILITSSCGNGFLKKMSKRKIQVIITSESDPVKAVMATLKGQELPLPE
jgi:predicted Fe-Mo cluster-binding NifX family protein